MIEMALVEEGQLSFKSFTLGLLYIPLILVLQLQFTKSLGLLLIYAVITNIAIKSLYKNDKYDIVVRGLGLGLFFSFSLMLSLSGTSLELFGWYCAALSFFHWSEYFTTAYTNPKNLSLQSYLLDHSKEYHIAAAGSLCEFLVEWYFFPSYKQPNIISVIGAVIVISGEVLRKIAMITAATNFNHYVQYAKTEGHKLVTGGVYGYFRHPAYVGWFYWSLGTQLMICNPVCLVGYVYASWRFFRSRIHDEELALLHFFGDEYVNYQKKVSTGLPFIGGYKYNF